MKKYYLILFLILFVSLHNGANAQQNLISGQVTDNAGNLLEHASVSIHNCTDSLLLNFTLTDKKGSFQFKTNKDSIILSISFIGFKPFIRKFSGLSKQSLLLQKITLEVADNILDEIKIDAFIPPLQFKKDTLIFNASAFKTTKIEVVSDLLAKLPRVTVNDGEVKVNGRPVSRILVDGKEFFGNNRNLLLNIFPADAIENVKVYDSPSDVLKNIKPNLRNKEISLTLRKNKKRGIFGNLKLSAGLKEKYYGLSSVNYFDRIVQISGEISNDNINSQGLDVAKTSGRNRLIDSYGSGYGMNNLSSFGNDEGFVTALKKGVFAEVSLGKTFLSTAENGLVGGTSSAKQHRLGAGLISLKRSMTGGSRTTELWNNNNILNESFQEISKKTDTENRYFLSYKFIPAKQVEWSTYFSYGANNANEKSLKFGNRNYVDKTVILNDSANTERQNQSFTIKSNLTARISKSKSLTLSAFSSKGNTDGRNDNISTLKNLLIDTLFFVRRFIKEDRRSQEFSADYSDLIDSQFTFKMRVSSYMQSSNNKTPAFLFNPLSNKFDTANDSISNFFKTKTFIFTATPELNYETGSFQFSGGLTFERQNISVAEPNRISASSSTYNQLGTSLSATIQNPFKLPVDLGINSGTSQTPPSSDYINPYLDISNPLLQIKGNAELTPEKNIDFGLSLRNHSSQLNFPLINLYFNYGIISGAITEAISEISLGSYLTEYLNSPDKSKRISFSVETSKYHYDVKKRISRSFNFSIYYVRTDKPYFFNKARYENLATNFNFAGQFMRFKENLSQFVSLNYSLYKGYSSLQSEGKFLNQSLQTSYTINYKINQYFKAEARAGYSYYFLQSRKNANAVVVDLKGEYTFKNKPMSIGIKAADIFNGEQIFTQSFNGLSFRTTEAINLRRYYLLFFSWQIKNLKKHKS
ncbi:MAG: outer membrane beta-barrel protein [Ginsengibacter sp.]